MFLASFVDIHCNFVVHFMCESVNRDRWQNAIRKVKTTEYGNCIPTFTSQLLQSLSPMHST